MQSMFSYMAAVQRSKEEATKLADGRAEVLKRLAAADESEAQKDKKEQDKEERRQEVLAKRVERVARKRALGSARQKEPAGAGDQVLAADDYLSIEVFEGDDEGTGSDKRHRRHEKSLPSADSVVVELSDMAMAKRRVHRGGHGR